MPLSVPMSSTTPGFLKLLELAGERRPAAGVIWKYGELSGCRVERDVRDDVGGSPSCHAGSSSFSGLSRTYS